MAVIPCFMDTIGELLQISSPSKKICPSVGCIAPVMILINVDFPAPFSPAMAWISPGRKARETPSRAQTPGKTFFIFFSSNMCFSIFACSRRLIHAKTLSLIQDFLNVLFRYRRIFDVDRFFDCPFLQYLGNCITQQIALMICG